MLVVGELTNLGLDYALNELLILLHTAVFKHLLDHKVAKFITQQGLLHQNALSLLLFMTLCCLRRRLYASLVSGLLRAGSFIHAR